MVFDAQRLLLHNSFQGAKPGKYQPDVVNNSTYFVKKIVFQGIRMARTGQIYFCKIKWHRKISLIRKVKNRKIQGSVLLGMIFVEFFQSCFQCGELGPVDQ
jgi:hypothetical protein